MALSYPGELCPIPPVAGITSDLRAYVVPKKKLGSIAEERAFGEGVQIWIASRVARHKYLRGGTWTISHPKRESSWSVQGSAS